MDHLVSELREIKAEIIQKHQSLYASDVNSLLNKIHLFGFHFSSLDIRQDSRAHAKVFNDMVNTLIESGSSIFPSNYHNLSEAKQVATLSKIKGSLDMGLISEKETLKALKTMAAIKTIQGTNGEKAANRYIISNN